MDRGRAFEVFANIDKYWYGNEYLKHTEVTEAIKEIAGNPTHNSITKAQMMEAIRYLLDIYVKEEF